MSLWNKLGSFCADLSPDCRAASRAQSEAVDHPLPRRKRLGLWLHLLLCPWCRRYGRQIRLLGAEAKKHQDELIAGDQSKLSREARDRIKQRLRKPDDPA
jgi:hypothetical protein